MAIEYIYIVEDSEVGGVPFKLLKGTKRFLTKLKKEDSAEFSRTGLGIYKRRLYA